MDTLIIKRSQLVTATLQGTTVRTRYNFDYIANISRNNIILYGICAYTAAQMAVTPNGETVIADADKDQITFTLVNTDNVEFINEMPLVECIRSDNGGIIMPIAPQRINLTDCYVQITENTGLAAGEVVAFNIFYDFA